MTSLSAISTAATILLSMLIPICISIANYHELYLVTSYVSSISLACYVQWFAVTTVGSNVPANAAPSITLPANAVSSCLYHI